MEGPCATPGARDLGAPKVSSAEGVYCAAGSLCFEGRAHQCLLGALASPAAAAEVRAGL